MTLEDPFLRDLWKHKAEEEKGETQEDRDLALYLQIKTDSKKYKSLIPFVSELDLAIGRYAEAVIRLSSVRQGKLEKEIIMDADRNRSLIHNALIDVINALSREYKKLGLTNNWRSDIMGNSRREIGDWALTVARSALNHN